MKIKISEVWNARGESKELAIIEAYSNPRQAVYAWIKVNRPDLDVASTLDSHGFPRGGNMKTKIGKIQGRVSFDAKYIFQLGPRPTRFCIERARYWDDEHLRNLEIARYLTHDSADKTITEKLFQEELEYLANKIGKSVDWFAEAAFI